MFNVSRANVSGTFTETSLKQITVNGVLAFISGNTFTALNVPLATGANTITATAEDISGNSTSTSINLTGGATLVDPVQLAATPVGGFATLNVTFTPTASAAPGTLQNVYYDFDGNGTTDQTESNLNPITHNYTAGQYFPVVTVQTTAGKFSSLGGWNSTTADRLRINVQSALVTESTITVTDPLTSRPRPMAIFTFSPAALRQLPSMTPAMQSSDPSPAWAPRRRDWTWMPMAMCMWR